MAWSFNPFTGNLDITGGGAVVFEGEVETFADLPETVGDPAVGSSFLVRTSTGVWLVNRRQAGIWIRRNNTGVRATDWEYGGDYPVNSVNGQTGNVVLGAGDVGAAASTHSSTHHTGGTDALAAHQINGQTIFGTASATYSTDQTLTANRARQFTISNTNAGGINVTLPTGADGTLVGDTYVVIGGGTVSGPIVVRRINVLSPLIYETLATITATGQQYRFRASGGTTGGWSLVPVDSHTHLKSQITDYGKYRIATTTTTAVAGELIAADTTAGSFTLTLPATPSNGDTVSIFDRAGTFDTNNLILGRNGSNIEGLAEDLDCNIEDAAFSLVYVDATTGWKVMPYFGNKTNFASPDPIGSVVRNTGAFTSLTANTVTANNGTITASAPVLDLSQTWNNAAVGFTALNVNAVNTASGAASFLANFQIGGSSVFSLLKDGSIGRINQTTGAIRSGFFLNGQSANRMAIYAGDSLVVYISPQDFGLDGSAILRWDSSGGQPTSTGVGLALMRDGANHVLGQRVGTNPQTFNIYNTWTNASNYERGFMRWSSNVLQIGTEAAGTGSNRNVEFVVAGSTRLTLSATTAAVLATTYRVNNNGDYQFGGPACRITGTSSGTQNITFQTFSTDRLVINDTLVGFGGTTSSFPALKRSSTTLQVRLANDSDFTAIQGKLTTETAYTAGAPTATGYLVLYDSNGTAYKVPAEAL